jgi:ABC-2 type transport system ATP-binding protein
MSDHDIAIRVERVSKDFVLPHEKVTTVKGLFTSAFRRQHTKEVQHALRDVTIEVKKGEFFGIVGRNGSGKSTLLKILAGIYQPTTGKVRTYGKLVPFIELGVGFNGELTGRENVYLNGALLGFSQREMDAMYDDIVHFAELERFMDQKLKNYSSGMQVRLAFSLATRAEADILLVDEVLAVGDADFQRKCFEYFRTLKRNKKTVVFVSHDMSAIREYCDRAVMIEQSKIVHAGTANEVAVQYVKLFNVPAKTGKKLRETSDKGRWGDSILEFSSIEAQTNDDVITVDMVARANGTIEDPVFGYLIKDSAGNELIGSNTKIKRMRLGLIARGDRFTIRWKIPNVFNDGIFILTAAISHNDGVTQCDWWENAATFTVFREDKTPYALNPNAQVEIIR